MRCGPNISRAPCKYLCIILFLVCGIFALPPSTHLFAPSELFYIYRRNPIRAELVAAQQRPGNGCRCTTTETLRISPRRTLQSSDERVRKHQAQLSVCAPALGSITHTSSAICIRSVFNLKREGPAEFLVGGLVSSALRLGPCQPIKVRDDGAKLHAFRLVIFTTAYLS